MWEANRLLTSGVATRNIAISDAFEDCEPIVHIIARETKPNFLTDWIPASKQPDIVSPFKDPNSDLAVFCRKGSRLVREKREMLRVSLLSPNAPGSSYKMPNTEDTRQSRLYRRYDF